MLRWLRLGVKGIFEGRTCDSMTGSEVCELGEWVISHSDVRVVVNGRG